MCEKVHVMYDFVHATIEFATPALKKSVPEAGFEIPHSKSPGIFSQGLLFACACGKTRSFVLPDATK